MVKAFDPSKSLKAAEDRVAASKERQVKLAQALEKREAAVKKASDARDKAKGNLDAEKRAEALSQAFIDRNTAVEPDGVPDGYDPADDQDDERIDSGDQAHTLDTQTAPVA